MWDDTKHADFASLLTSRGLLQERLGHVPAAIESHSEALEILQRVRPQGCQSTERVKCRLAKLTEATPSPVTA
jgi:hypothetical protein